MAILFKAALPFRIQGHEWDRLIGVSIYPNLLLPSLPKVCCAL